MHAGFLAEFCGQLTCSLLIRQVFGCDKTYPEFVGRYSAVLPEDSLHGVLNGDG
jgi:hypothetical protein